MELKRRVAHGFFWHSLDRFGNTALQTLVSLILARLLTPADFGLVSIVVIFSLIAQSIVDSGFSQAIIRKQSPSDSDYTSVFYVNISVAAVVYTLLLLATPFIAKFYNQPQLNQIGPVLFSLVFVNALGFVQNTYLTKTLNFKLMSKITLSTSLVSGIIAIYMAYQGLGVWAIVTQMVLRDLLKVIAMWAIKSWRPKGWVRLSAIKELMGFGSTMMITGIIGQVSTNLSQLFVGRVYSPTMLGYYYQSQKLRDTFTNTISVSIMNVTFPALAELQHDRKKLREATRKVVIAMSFIMFPLLTGLIAMAEELFSLILTDKWLGAVPYFRIFCLAAYLIPAATTSFNILRIKGKGKFLLRLETAKQILLFSILFATINISIVAVAWAMVAYALVNMTLNHIYAAKENNYGFVALIKDSLPYAAISIAMLGGIIGVGLVVDIPLLWLVALKALIGASIYMGLSIVFKVEAWLEIKSILQKK